MSAIARDGRRSTRWFAFVAGLLLAVLIAAACGNEGEGAAAGGFQKVTPSDSVFAFDDFLSIGFKKDKQYNVEELPGGVDAWTGFWGPDPSSRKVYEIRFYGSHDDAVEHGPALAEEVTGPNAAEFRKNPTWKEGAKDRWQSASTADLVQRAVGPSPRYGDYVIFGNILMLCEGGDSGQGLKRCEALIDALTDVESG